MPRFCAVGAAWVFCLVLASPAAHAQSFGDSICRTDPTRPGCSPASPLVETSAGRAWQRITFGAIDCDAEPDAFGFPSCGQDAFSQSEVFNNGTYKEIRFFYGGRNRSTEGGPQNVAESLANRVLTQSQTFPTASSAAGFTFTWRGGPTPVQDSQLFGPLFGDRGRSNGKDQLSVTFSVQRLRWASLDEAKIRVGEAGLLWGDPDYLVGDDGTLFGYSGRCIMDIDTTMATLALNYGVTDRLDVGVAVPVMHTTVEGSNEFVDFVVFPDGSISNRAEDTGFIPQGRFYVRGSSTGVGDIQLAGNYALLKGQSAAVALSARASLGTGSLDKMIGTGETQVRAGVAGSYEAGRFAPHARISYSWGNDVLFDEFSYVAGLDVDVVSNRLTVGAELVGRRLFGVQGFERGPLIGDGHVNSFLNPQERFEVRQYGAVRDDFDLYFVTAGSKVRVAGQLLVSAYVLIPFGDQGLIAQRPTLNIGFNHTF